MSKKSTGVPKFSLGFDTETSGFSLPYFASKHQMISYGAVIVDNESLEIVDALYNEIKFDDTKYSWDAGAEAVHGLSREHLSKNGLSSMEAGCALAEFMLKYFGPQPSIMLIGHNPKFDVAFMKQLLEPLELMPNLYDRMIDTSVLGFTAFNNTRSDFIFSKLGFEDRGSHNALEDIFLTVGAVKKFREVFKSL
jgi:DNA polymerase III epsilon subunit-like protein